MPPHVGGWIASANELYSLERHPGLVRCPPESILLNELSQEGNCSLRAVPIRCRKIDLVAEDDKPSTNLSWRQNNSIERLSVLAILLECLDKQVWCRGTRKIKTSDLHVWKLPQSTKQRHRLARTRWSTKQQRLVFGKPRIENLLVAKCIHGGNDDICLCYRMRIEFNRRNLRLPRYPVSLRQGNIIVDYRICFPQSRKIKIGQCTYEVAESFPFCRRAIPSECPNNSQQ